MAELSAAGISLGAYTSSPATLPIPCRIGSASVGRRAMCRRMSCCASSMPSMGSAPLSEAESDELAVHRVVEILLQQVEFFQEGDRLRAEHGFPSAGAPFLAEDQRKSETPLHGVDVGPRLAVGDSHRLRGRVDRPRLPDEAEQVLASLSEYWLSVHFQPDLGAHPESGIPAVHGRNYLSMKSSATSESSMSSSGTARSNGSSLAAARSIG